MQLTKASIQPEDFQLDFHIWMHKHDLSKTFIYQSRFATGLNNLAI